MSMFFQNEAIVFDPKWWDSATTPFWDPSTNGEVFVKVAHPLTKGEVVYFLGLIPNVPGHCIVAKYSGQVVAMVHPEDFRRAKEEEL